MTAKRAGSAAASARKPSRTRRWKARSNSASKRVTSPGDLRARPASTRQVQQDRQVRHQAVGGDRLERAQPLQRDARAVALVGQRRVRVAGADDGVPAASAGRITSSTSWRRAALNRNASVGASVGAVGAGAGQEDVAQPLAEPGPAGLAGQMTSRRPPPGWPRGRSAWRRLAGAVGPLDRDEPAATGASSRVLPRRRV